MTDLLPIVCAASVTNGSDTITVTGTDASTGIAAVLSDLNCHPLAGVLLAGLGYLVKARLTTTTLQLERPYEGSTATGVSCTISPVTPEMVQRLTIARSLQDYSARAALIAANAAGLSYVYSSATSGAPADGQLAFDAADLSAATLIRLNNADASGQTITDRLDRWAVGDEITVRATDGSARVTFVVSSDPIDETGYRQAGLTYSGADGVLAAGADVVVERLAKGETGGVVGTAAGVYAAGTTYSSGQYVTDQMSSWVYINATPGSGHAPPTLPTTANSYWQLLTAQGATGPAGLIGNWRGPWVTGTAYAADDAVSNSGSSYIVPTGQAHTAGASFATDLAAGKWQLVVSKGDTGAAGADGADGANGIFTAIASQAEAQAGTDNTKGMTPLRTLQALKTYGVGAVGGDAQSLILDANAMLTSGQFIVGSAWTGSPIAGTDSGNQGYLEVQAFPGLATYCRQVFTSLAGLVYRRILNGGAWTNWVSPGEYVSSTVAAGSAISLTNAANQNITSVSLTAGDWDCWGEACFKPGSGATPTLLQGWLSTVSATAPNHPNGGAEFRVLAGSSGGFLTTGDSYVFPVGFMRLALAATTTLYLGVQTSFSGGSLSGYGFLGARRAR